MRNRFMAFRSEPCTAGDAALCWPPVTMPPRGRLLPPSPLNMDLPPSSGGSGPAAVKHSVVSESIYAASFSGVTCWTTSSRSGLRATV